ncbi:NAD-dependent epimerase/dehydratase family protein [Pectinatus frisingensis]|uniref:NAD-dependent epimerase/dehydratase family protein n=1 Tax=Pectinatus frisingensis TaxID=865 RepID=UPI0018C79D21|nr:NAD-dependent epimerase/dehydratase family protein [Pectinatus frisingensis]
MNILIAGGAGFIGSNLAYALLKRGHRVVCIDNFFIGTRNNIAYLEQENEYVFYEENLNNLETISKIMRKEKIEYVFHLAANSDIQASAQNPIIEYENTYSTTVNLLEAMRICKIKRIFFASTSAVYGDKRNIFLDENTVSLEPISYYGAAKLGSEALIHAYTYMNDMSSLIFRFPNVIGPYLTHGVVFDFIKKLQKDKRHLEILGNGQQTKPYIYVGDLVRAILQFMEQPQGVHIYNVGVESNTSVTHIADIICKELKLFDVKYTYTGGIGGWKGDVPRFRYCLDKIHMAGWQAEYTSDEAVRLAVKWAVKQ